MLFRSSWVIKVLKDEDRYTASLRDENLVSGTLYKKGEEAVLPLGTVTIEETEAAPGYINDGTFDGFKMYIGQIKASSGSGETGLVDVQGTRESSNSFEVQDTPFHSCHLLFGHFQCALIHGPDIPGSYAILLFTASDLASITSHIHSSVLFLLWLHPFILSGVISPLISSSILGTY